MGRSGGRPDGVGADSRRVPELCKPCSKPISVGSILSALRQVQQPALQIFQGLEYRAVVLRQQALRDVYLEVWIDTEQMSIERGMVNLR